MMRVHDECIVGCCACAASIALSHRCSGQRLDLSTLVKLRLPRHGQACAIVHPDVDSMAMMRRMMDA